MMEAVRPYYTPALTRATWRYVPGDDILHSHRREYLQCYIIPGLFVAESVC
jgi:hypothetical protein